jgi:rod shape-determining protein MreD
VSAARAIVFFLVAYAALIVSSALTAIFPLHGFLPDAVLLIVIYLGLHARAPAPGMIAFALAVGYLGDLFSGAPRGLHALTLALVMMTARGLSSRLLVDRRWQEMVVALLAATAHGAATVAVASPMYEGNALEALAALPASVAATALLAPLAFAFFRRLDRKLAPDPRAIRMA